MWDGIKRRAGKAWLNLRCRGIYDSKPVQCDPASLVVVVSQVYHPDMTMYLLAAKSFAQHIRPQRFVVVDDGLRPADQIALRRHLGQISFIPRRQAHLAGLPEGGCWERLLTLADQNKDHYVVQLDSDTLTLAPPVEVQACIAAQRCFTLGTSSGRHTVPLAEASRYALERRDSHVQSLAECALEQLDPGGELRYVRGCAGFTGFPPGSLEVGKIRDFSLRMEGLIGASKWREWGSEQVTSNFFAANSPASLVLPVDTYPFWGPGVDIERAVLVHFFGTFRFSRGMYAKTGARVASGRLLRAH
jgi:hypothetical protein